MQGNHPQDSQDKPRLNNFEIEERALEAQVWLNDPVLSSALDDIYSKATGTLLTSDIGSLTASAAHASMKAVVDLRSQLGQYITDHKMRQKYNKGDK
jgi:hypothetical protein